MPVLPAGRIFAAQFEEEGDYFLYRPDSDGPAVRVSAEEREAFVTAYERYLCFGVLILLAAALAMTALIVAMLLPAGRMDDFLEVFFAGLVLLMVAFIPFSRRAFNAPRRALRGRLNEIAEP
jgi:hypothetical protein